MFAMIYVLGIMRSCFEVDLCESVHDIGIGSVCVSSTSVCMNGWVHKHCWYSCESCCRFWFLAWVKQRLRHLAGALSKRLAKSVDEDIICYQ